MKNKLEEHFGERIVLTEINGQPIVITFRTAANVVLQEEGIVSRKEVGVKVASIGQAIMQAAI